MDWMKNHLWREGKFLGVSTNCWEVIGWLGNAAFFSRFIVQWYATEKLKRVVVPVAFWWLSLTGSLLLLVYALSHHIGVFIFAYLFPWIPYVRNLIIHYRHQDAHIACTQCGKPCPPQSNFCCECGAKVTREGTVA